MPSGIEVVSPQIPRNYGSFERRESDGGSHGAVLRIFMPSLIAKMCSFPRSGLTDKFSPEGPLRSWGWDLPSQSRDYESLTF